jgi:UDP-2,3-diacylglucosamine hydrolase
VIRNKLNRLFAKSCCPRNAEIPTCAAEPSPGDTAQPIGIIAGNGTFPLRFANEAKKHGRSVVAVCHLEETDPAIEQAVDKAVWIKVGELGRLISAFKDNNVSEVALVGGINRIKHFGQVKLDLRGAALLMKLRSAKDDVIMRGIADELAKEGVQVIDCTVFLKSCLAREEVYTKSQPTDDEQQDIEVGIAAIKAMSAQDIGQVVVVREGVVVAVEAVEGTNATIARGGTLGGPGTVVVKFAKPTQDMRFDVPTVGVKTIETLTQAKARVLALEAGRCMIMDEQQVVELANKYKVAIVGCKPLV